ncbi:hypothetical protein OU789_08665 [Halocynthiibacter sp. C4]|uniref:hypothetical protein n=1 Tax=Halocynthiibacter sp. C4 TaxID=2992758 RepID=UPI00237A3EA8|nr:hypothetical protein [Halocynthiibacter sp. C4]MDE0589994.1 hypothetical protein [Halocynthiibacter sp. C4]
MFRSTLALAFASVALAGCVENSGSDYDYSNSSSATAVAEAACLSAVAAQTNRPLSDHSVGQVLTSEAGISVDVIVAGAENRWSCLSDAAGNVQGASYVGEG